MLRQSGAAVLMSTVLGFTGCCSNPEITAVSLSPYNSNEEEGIPFYLPKPLLIVSKNFRYIEEPKVGLTDSAPIPAYYDDQSKYADVNARTNFTTGSTSESPLTTPGSNYAVSEPVLHSNGAPLTPFNAPSDGLTPETFYTYQVIFVPDLTQKYGLKIKGGNGEIRAAMNLVNGWQYTGMGPFYMKDSSTAQNILATGITANLAASGVADVVESVAGLAGQLQNAPAGPISASDPKVVKVSESLQALDCSFQPLTLVNFAEIHVYEPQLSFDGRMEWVEIVCLNFNRDALAAKQVCTETTPVVQAAAKPPDTAPDGVLQSGLPPDAVSAAVSAAFGVPPGTGAFTPTQGGLQSGAAGGVLPSGNFNQNQVQVDCGDDDADCPREFNMFKIGGWKPWHHHDKERPTVSRRVVLGTGPFLPPNPTPTPPASPASSQGGFSLQSAPAATATPGTVQPVINNQIINQPERPPTDAAGRASLPVPPLPSPAANVIVPPESVVTPETGGGPVLK